VPHLNSGKTNKDRPVGELATGEKKEKKRNPTGESRDANGRGALPGEVGTRLEQRGPLTAGG